MDKALPSGLRILFIIHVLVAAIFGVAFLFAPVWSSSIYGIKVDGAVAEVLRLIGAAMLGWGTSSLLGMGAKNLAELRIVLWSELLWTLLGALVMVYALLFAGFPALGWFNAAIFGAFALGFAFFATRKE